MENVRITEVLRLVCFLFNRSGVYSTFRFYPSPRAGGGQLCSAAVFDALEADERQHAFADLARQAVG